MSKFSLKIFVCLIAATVILFFAIEIIKEATRTIENVKLSGRDCTQKNGTMRLKASFGYFKLVCVRNGEIIEEYAFLYPVTGMASPSPDFDLITIPPGLFDSKTPNHP